MEQTLTLLGWKPAFRQQLSPEELESTVPARVIAVHKGSVVLAHEQGTVDIAASLFKHLPEVTVGDWLLLDSKLEWPLRLLDRSSLIRRKAPGEQHTVQLIAANVDVLFDDLHNLGDCRFQDCSHSNEPGCALLAAVADGSISQRRLDSYHKLMREQRHNAESLAERHERMRKTGRLYKSIQNERRRSKSGDGN